MKWRKKKGRGGSRLREEAGRGPGVVGYKLKITFIKKNKTYNLIKTSHIKSCSFSSSPLSLRLFHFHISHISSKLYCCLFMPPLLCLTTLKDQKVRPLFHKKTLSTPLHSFSSLSLSTLHVSLPVSLSLSFSSFRSISLIFIPPFSLTHPPTFSSLWCFLLEERT